MGNVNINDVKELIIYAVERLSECELSEENGWSQKDFDGIEFVLNGNFEVVKTNQEA